MLEVTMSQGQDKQDFLPLVNSLQALMCYLIQGEPVVSLGGFLSKCLLDVSLPWYVCNHCPVQALGRSRP